METSLGLFLGLFLVTLLTSEEVELMETVVVG